MLSPRRLPHPKELARQLSLYLRHQRHQVFRPSSLALPRRRHHSSAQRRQKTIRCRSKSLCPLTLKKLDVTSSPSTRASLISSRSSSASRSKISRLCTSIPSGLCAAPSSASVRSCLPLIGSKLLTQSTEISWLAARAITHKFLRIYDPSLPEKYDPSSPPTSFPTPAQVMATPVADLRAAGLSGRKVEYVQDLAARFADGRLDPVKLVAMTDDEVMEHLVAIRGIGPWSVHMQNIFASSLVAPS